MLALLLLLLDPEALVQKLADPSIEVREDAGLELQRLGARAFAALEAGLSHADPEVCARALSILVARLDALPPDLFARQARLRETKMVRDAEGALAKLAAKRSYCRGPDRAKAVEAWPELRALRECGPGVIPILLREIEGPAAIHAVVALGLFDDPRAAGVLDALAQSKEVISIFIGG